MGAQHTPGPLRVLPGTYEGGKYHKIVPVDYLDSTHVLVGGEHAQALLGVLAVAPEMRARLEQIRESITLMFGKRIVDEEDFGGRVLTKHLQAITALLARIDRATS